MSPREFERFLGRRYAARVARGETFIEVKEGLRTRLRGEVLSDVNPTGLAYGAPQVLVVGQGRDQTRHLQGIPGQESRPSVLNQFAVRRDVRDDHGQPGRHRLE